jgi:hypothetical protein
MNEHGVSVESRFRGESPKYSQRTRLRDTVPENPHGLPHSELRFLK